MKFLEKEEVYRWLRKYNYTVDNNGNPRSNLKLSSERIESDAGKRVCQAKNLLKNFEDKDESLLFYTDWSIWSSGEDMNLFNRLSLSHGEGRPLIAPGSIPRSLLRTFNFEIWKLKCLGACPEDLYLSVLVMYSQKKNFQTFPRL